MAWGGVGCASAFSDGYFFMKKDQMSTRCDNILLWLYGYSLTHYPEVWGDDPEGADSINIPPSKPHPEHH